MWLALVMAGGKHEEPVGHPVGISHGWSSCAILVGQSLCWLLLLCWLQQPVNGVFL